MGVAFVNPPEFLILILLLEKLEVTSFHTEWFSFNF
jgi:hypothetical protein